MVTETGRLETSEYWFAGECMVELREAHDELLCRAFGGDVWNTAIYFRREAPGRRTCFVSAVGTDSLSRALLERTEQSGVDVRLVSSQGGRPPGVYLIETGEQGERTFLYWRSNSASRQMLDGAHTDMLRSHVGNCALLYFSGITLAILSSKRRNRLLNLASMVREQGGWVAFDSNYRPALWNEADEARKWNAAALAVATHALVTFDDEEMLHGDDVPQSTLTRILESGPLEVVVKLGAEGCLVQSGSMAHAISVPAKKVTPVDTTAAGDSFNGAYLAARLKGATPQEAAEVGAELAAQVIQVRGAIIDDA